MKAVTASIAAALALTGCMGSGGPPPRPIPGAGQLSGTIAYRERMALPPGATIEVTIIDAQRADAPARTVATTRFAARGRQVPIPYSLRYRGFSPDWRVRATIRDRGRLLFTTDTATTIPPGGRLDLWLVSAGR
jgi:putative lipoprotein